MFKARTRIVARPSVRSRVHTIGNICRDAKKLHFFNLRVALSYLARGNIKLAVMKLLAANLFGFETEITLPPS